MNSFQFNEDQFKILLDVVTKQTNTSHETSGLHQMEKQVNSPPFSIHCKLQLSLQQTAIRHPTLKRGRLLNQIVSPDKNTLV